VKIKYNLPNQYILSVGTIEARKNILAIVKAMPKINADFKLIIIGKEKPYADKVKREIERLGLADRIIFLKDIPFKDLPSIYQIASLFVLPSYYEGFGIPIIEALYSKVPVVAATGSCLEEAGGPDSLYVDPDDFKGFSTEINNVLVNSSLQQAMKEKGLQYVQKFNNEVINEHLMSCYRKTVNI
ncbi:MAG: glycosyltransferase family 1 protein, partial [Pedobacter sp.]